MKLLLLVIVMVVVAGFLGGVPADPSKTFPNVSLGDDFQANVLNAPLMDGDVMLGMIYVSGLVVIGVLSRIQGDAETGYMIGVILALAVIIILAYGLLSGFGADVYPLKRVP